MRSEDNHPPSWLPILFSQIGSQVKRRQSQSHKFKELDKISNFWILKQTFHATHLLKLIDQMCKCEMDPTSIVEDTERTRFCPQTDRRTRWNQYTPFQLRWSGGYIEATLNDMETRNTRIKDKDSGATNRFSFIHHMFMVCSTGISAIIRCTSVSEATLEDTGDEILWIY